MSQKQYIGQRISYDGALCTVRYIGGVAGTSGNWLGVEWDDSARGKHDGSHKGVRYFTCISKASTGASFVRPTRPADAPQSFLAALNEKYVADAPDANQGRSKIQIVISGKVAEEMGFEKIWQKQSQLRELKIVIVDGLRVAFSTDDGDTASIAETCPKIVQLDLSRNLFERFGPVVDICRDLKALQKLSINGNRFRGILDEGALNGAEAAFREVNDLALGETLLSWEELCCIASKCASLTNLMVGTNQLSTLPAIDYSHLSSTLTSINLEYNDFTSLSDVASLTTLKALRNLYLKGNNISTLVLPDSPAPIFPTSLHYLDLSYNKIGTWEFIDQLTTHFPGLTGLRIAHNPVYDSVDLESNAQSSDESFMFTVARISQLRSLNFTHITAADRTNAEMFYLSRIAKQLATVPEGAEHTIKALHPRYAELCDNYGEPDVIRRQEINASFLEARLITAEFHYEDVGRKTTRVPKSFDIYAVKGIVGKLFGLAPLRLRLVWETGEWDPVAGFDEKDGDSSDEEDEVPMEVDEDAGDDKDVQGQTGRWLKREVELTDGPKQLGYCVDGSKVSIRVELCGLGSGSTNTSTGPPTTSC